ncbi:YqaJ viral recombinase family nuclease [Hominisplanchenecus faecis]
MKLHKLISTVDMSHEEWLRYRKLGIGGSDAGSICGLNPYSSAIAVFQDKTQKEAGEKEDNEAMRQGRNLEEYVARRFMEETGKKVRRANAIYGHPDHDFMMANVDRLVVGENAGLECKTASAYSADKWKDGHIPESYEIQCHHYMAVTGADAWYIACVILGKEFIWRKIERDEETIQMLIDIESDFWQNNVKADKMPAPDGSKAAEELLQKYYGSSEPEKMIPLVDFDEKLERRAEISDLQDKLEKEKKQIEQEIKVYMEDAEMAVSDLYCVTWKSVTANRVDSKQLKADFPEIYKQVLKQSENRRFTVKRAERA